MIEHGYARSWGRMAIHATRAKRLRRLAEVRLALAARLLGTVKRDAGRTHIAPDVMVAAVRVYLRFSVPEMPMRIRALLAEAVVEACQCAEVHAAAESARIRRLTGARVVLNVLAVLRYRAATRVVAVARATARTLRACVAILAHALSQRGPLPCRRSMAGPVAL